MAGDADQTQAQTISFSAPTVPAEVAGWDDVHYIIVALIGETSGRITTGCTFTEDSDDVDVAGNTIESAESMIAVYTWYDADAGANAPNSTIDTASMAGYDGYKAVSSQFGFLTFNLSLIHI